MEHVLQVFHGLDAETPEYEFNFTLNERASVTINTARGSSYVSLTEETPILKVTLPKVEEHEPPNELEPLPADELAAAVSANINPPAEEISEESEEESEQTSGFRIE